MMAAIRSEWTKLLTVRSWQLSLLASIALTLLVSLMGAAGSSTDSNEHPPLRAPDGIAVKDAFHFDHTTLEGDGSITARVASFSGVKEFPAWAKAGVMVKESTEPGSRYAAVMTTAEHGVRLQWNYVGDRAGAGPTGPDGRTPWLRITRDGARVSAHQSTDGTAWKEVGSVAVGFTASSVELGLFVASPMYLTTERGIAGSSAGASSTQSTASFTDVSVSGTTRGEWRSEDIGSTGEGPPTTEGSTTPTSAAAAGTFTLVGSGDIAPDGEPDNATRLGLSGAYLGVIPVITLAALLMTAEYRSGMVATTVAATSRRHRVVLAKATVIGVAAFLSGLIACVAAYLVTQPILRDNGFAPPTFRATSLTDPDTLQAVVGSAAVIGLVGVLSLGVATIVRRSAPAITLVILVMVLPQLLVAALPVGAARVMLQVTPGAGWSVQQTATRFPQIESFCLPEDGCVFDQPVVGLGVTALYAVIALLVAGYAFRRRDA
ncbi:hypothetical protein V6K52_18135 [Knoellia sp. S7-12]|uniref:hypothetical protein n=1 Tax=Knoellia sp. S7-12 TaxID=3126698 RepID=UPI003366D795